MALYEISMMKRMNSRARGHNMHGCYMYGNEQYDEFVVLLDNRWFNPLGIHDESNKVYTTVFSKIEHAMSVFVS